jgi:hypothetical protein
VPTIDVNLLREFRLYLADLDIKNKAAAIRREAYRNRHFHFPEWPYLWIENLLQTPISDHRKYTLELVLAPYLVVIKHQSYDVVYSIIKKWAMTCNALKGLDWDFLCCH